MDNATAFSHKLGLNDLLSLDDATELDYLERIQAGLPVNALDAFIEAEILSKDDTIRVIGSERTISRRRIEGKLSSEESDKFLRLARTVVRAVEVFGSTEKANQWFYLPNQSLSGKTPAQLLNTELGNRLIETILGRIAYGVFS